MSARTSRAMGVIYSYLDVYIPLIEFPYVDIPSEEKSWGNKTKKNNILSVNTESNPIQSKNSITALEMDRYREKIIGVYHRVHE